MELFIYFPPLKYIFKILRHARKSFTATLTGSEAVQQNKKKRYRKHYADMSEANFYPI